MKRYIYAILCATIILSCQKKDNGSSTESSSLSIVTEEWDGNKRSDVTYQLLIYSFADSDGDGIGDFNGIIQHLDYLDGLGINALWLSPIHPAVSYHGYDVKDYNAINTAYGTEDDFKNLIFQAHQKGIKIYMDYVLNHSSVEHPWFKSAVADYPGGFGDYYVLSRNPKADIVSGNIPMISTEGVAGYDSGQWFLAPGQAGLGAKGRFRFSVDWTDANAPKVTVFNSSDAAQVSNSDKSVMKFLYFGKEQLYRLYNKGGNIFEIVVDFDSDWGFLLRTSDTQWTGGTKFGAPSGGGSVQFGVPYQLTNAQECEDCIFTEPIKYHSHFWTGYFADFNYGPSSVASKSAPFKNLALSADKWIGIGIDGLRLDAVKHIYHNANSNENPDFLKQWYDRCNQAYKSAGHEDDIYMVGEQYSGANEVAPYYKGLPAFFEFDYWNRLVWALNNETGRYFAKDIIGYRNLYKNYRQDAIAATKLTNHDEDRAASGLGKDIAKIRQAAAVLLTSDGKPYIYQGEELGYWGTKNNGDEFVRTPMMWDAAGNNLAIKGINSKVDASMLSASISVENQLKDKNSLLNLYRRLLRLRNTYPAMAYGDMSKHLVYNESNSEFNSIAAWYMISGSDKMLVLHNFCGVNQELLLDDDLSYPVFLNGTAEIKQKTLSLGAYSSVVFSLK